MPVGSNSRTSTVSPVRRAAAARPSTRISTAGATPPACQWPRASTVGPNRSHSHRVAPCGHVSPRAAFRTSFHKRISGKGPPYTPRQGGISDSSTAISAAAPRCRASDAMMTSGSSTSSPGSASAARSCGRRRSRLQCKPDPPAAALERRDDERLLRVSPPFSSAWTTATSYARPDSPFARRSS